MGTCNLIKSNKGRKHCYLTSVALFKLYTQNIKKYAKNMQKIYAS